MDQTLDTKAKSTWSPSCIIASDTTEDPGGSKKRASSFNLELPGDDLVNGRIRLNIAMVKERFRWLTSSKYFTKLNLFVKIFPTFY